MVGRLFGDLDVDLEGLEVGATEPTAPSGDLVGGPVGICFGCIVGLLVGFDVGFEVGYE